MIEFQKANYICFMIKVKESSINLIFFINFPIYTLTSNQVKDKFESHTILD